jgi:hypothetical protein
MMGETIDTYEKCIITNSLGQSAVITKTNDEYLVVGYL